MEIQPKFNSRKQNFFKKKKKRSASKQKVLHGLCMMHDVCEVKLLWFHLLQCTIICDCWLWHILHLKWHFNVTYATNEHHGYCTRWNHKVYLIYYNVQICDVYCDTYLHSNVPTQKTRCIVHCDGLNHKVYLIDYNVQLCDVYCNTYYIKMTF